MESHTILSTTKIESHPDGDWNTSCYKYKGKEIIIKSAGDKGMKAHVKDEYGIAFTHRFVWIKPDRLLARIKSRIDMWDSGTWVPKKRIKK